MLPPFPAARTRSVVAVWVVAGVLLASCSDPPDESGPSDPAEAADQALSEALAAEGLRPIDDEPPADLPFADTELGLTELDNLVTTTTLPGQVVTEFVLDIDDCFDRLETLVQGRPTTLTTRLACDEPHGFQIFSRLEYPAAPGTLYPGDDTVDDFALLSCYQRFADWADAAYETSALDIGVFTPHPDDFENESAPYRGIHCYVFRLDGESLLDTARSSGL